MKTTDRYILMLEDDSDDRHITEAIFAEQHYDIGLKFFTEADGALQFLDDCHKNGTPFPSLILIDKYLRVRDGAEVLQLIKSHPVYRQIPAVIISGSSHPDDIAESYRLGANSYIVKPAYNGLTVKKISTFVSYWFEVAELPLVNVRDMAYNAGRL